MGIATNQGGGITLYGRPGHNPSANLNNVTITRNNSSFGVSGVLNSGSVVNVSNTIIAQNADRDCGGSSFNSLGFNLIGNNQDCAGFEAGANGDLVGSPGNPIDANL